MITYDLEKDILLPVSERIKDRADSLLSVQRFINCGIEAWFKVETVAALREKISRLQNHGPDLLLTDGTKIEMKGATNLAPSSIREGLKYGAPCLFLGCTSNLKKFISAMENQSAEVRISELVSVENKMWVVGIAKVSSYSPQ